MESRRFEIAIAIANDDPAFDGHFPGRPILPGVVLLAKILVAIEAAIDSPLADLTIRQAKFHAAVAPGDNLAIELVIDGDVAFTVLRHTTRVASGNIIIDGGRGRGR